MQRHVQPRESAPRNRQRVQEEIQNFLRAIESYPTRFAKEPRVSFQSHLRSFFSQVTENSDRPTPGRPSSPHKSSAA
jgi:hypothetical protein